jgi:DNA polymerase-3 subunit gamma/tau
MENFVVSARKYRPQNFESVVGQSHITTTLRNAIKNNQVAHAFLFCGPRGVGKTTCARILAKTINCENPSDGEPCNECQSCRTFNEGTSLNIHELDGASNNLVEDMRSLIDQTRYPPQSGKYKVYIIDEVHMLTSNAFNAFLKTLEEPPPYVIFILATTEKQKIIPTILSRCQVFDFRRITVQDTVRHLQEICGKENIRAEEDALHLIAVKSEGCLRDSLSILDKIASFTNGDISYRNTLEQLEVLDYDYFFQVMDAVADQDAARLLLIFDEVLQKGFEGDNFLDGLAEFIRNLLVCSDPRVIHLMEVSPGLESRYRKASQGTDPAFLVCALQIINEISLNYRQARNKRLHLEMGLIRLSYLAQAVRLISDDKTGEVAKKKLTDPAVVQRLRQPFARPEPALSRKVTAGIPAAAEPVLEKKEDPLIAPITGATGQQTGSDRASGLPDSQQPVPTGKRLTLLKGMKESLNIHVPEGGPGEITPLTQENLAEKWNLFTSQFRITNNSSVAAYLEAATLAIVSGNEVQIISNHLVQFRFIEEEKISISTFLKKEFHQAGLVVSTKVEENPLLQEISPAPLSSREQYLKMIALYPLIVELKEKLKLDIDG